MNKKLLYIAGAIVAVPLLIYSLYIIFSPTHALPGMQGTNTNPTMAPGGLYSQGTGQGNQQTTQDTSSGTDQTSAPTPAKVKFDTSTYKPFSQQVYPGPLSQNPSVVMDGTTITSQKQADGTLIVTAKVNGQPGYAGVTVTARPGDSVYYVAMSYPTPSQDYGDTGLLVVDKDGYIVPPTQ